MFKTLKKIFDKTDGAQLQSGPSPVLQGPAGAITKGTASTGEKPAEKRPHKPRTSRADNKSGIPHAVERTGEGEKPAKPAVKEDWDAKPRSDRPCRERKPKPVDN